jgi:hypothetical protein
LKGWCDRTADQWEVDLAVICINAQIPGIAIINLRNPEFDESLFAVA